jgi:nicotinate-nucleotide adenylyltransferase
VAARDGQAAQAPAALHGVAHRCVTIDLPRQDISASAVRERLAAGLPVAPLVGESVAGYIAQHRPYPGPH